jgi:hypothetical protein
LCVVDGLAFTAADCAGLEIVATRQTAGYQGALGRIGDVVLLASLESGDHGFRAIDISDPTSPTMVGDAVGPAEISAEDIVVIGEYAYVASISVRFTSSMFGTRYTRSLPESTTFRVETPGGSRHGKATFSWPEAAAASLSITSTTRLHRF